MTELLEIWNGFHLTKNWTYAWSVKEGLAWDSDKGVEMGCGFIDF